MGAYKQLLAQDIIITPFEVNKGFTFNSSQFTGSDVGIDRFLGTNITGLFNPNTDPTTGNISTQYKRLIYNSIKELYYSNYLSGSYGSSASLAVLIPGNDTEGNRLVGDTYTPAFDNYLQTTLSYPHYFPTQSNADIGVFSIPSRLFGNYIQPKSFVWKDGNYDMTFIDDGEGNIIVTGNGATYPNTIIGNIIYQHGIIIISYELGVDPLNIYDFVDSTNVTCSFSSSYSIYETQYKCTIRESEFNFSQNPTLLSGSSNDTIYNFATGSYFAPYITTVGLYDDQQNLIAVGKLAQPLPSSRTTDMTIYVNIDR